MRTLFEMSSLEEALRFMKTDAVEHAIDSNPGLTIVSIAVLLDRLNTQVFWTNALLPVTKVTCRHSFLQDGGVIPIGL